MSKINLPVNYTVLPKFFSGYEVNNLQIIGEYGIICWPGITNVKNIDFS